MTSGKVESQSAAQWFKENSEIAGFDNPGKSTFTSVRELVENSLDACEEDIEALLEQGTPIDEFPHINVIIKQVSHEFIRRKIIEHLDASGLLEDIEEFEIEEDDTVKYYVIEVEDNGPGIPHEVVSLLFGKVFTGTKYGIKQGRGRFGMGAKMAMIHAQRTTGLASEIWTSTRESPETSYFRIRIELKSNSPIYSTEQFVPDEPWHGLRMRLYIGGNLIWAKRYIVEYFKQLALVTPYVTFRVLIGEEKYNFKRVTNELPPLPSETKPHPEGVDVETLKEMTQRYPKMYTTLRNEKKKGYPTLAEFLINDFQGIGEGTAKKFLRYKVELDPNMSLNKLNEAYVFKLSQDMSSYDDFPAPDSSCLSILPPASLEEAAKALLEPEFITSVTGKIIAIKGHSVHITTSVAFGGHIPIGVNLYRFANRIPLLFKESSDVCHKALEEANIKRYVDINVHGVTVIVSVVSTRIPYQDAAKDFIANYDELRETIKLSIQKAFRKIRRYISQKQEAKRKERELEKLYKYADRLSKSIAKITRGTPMSQFEIQQRLVDIIESEYT